MAPAPTASLPTSPTSLKPPHDRNIKNVVLGDILFNTWFHSLYPEELVGKDTDRLHVCKYCFRYARDPIQLLGHSKLCELQGGPPGEKVYDFAGYAVTEVDGEEQKLFTQNLSLFAKLFLDHKSVFFDVSGFLYYILTYQPAPTSSPQILGFFSKEKLSWDANNLACILIFPPFQHRQLGKLLMGVSYKLSGWEWEGGVIGGPEKPLSEMGRRSYGRFWEERVARYLLRDQHGLDGETGGPLKGKGNKKREEMTIKEIGLATGMLAEDVVTALKGMGLVEPVKAGKKRKSSGEVDGEGSNVVIIKKEKVREWATAKGVDLVDPVHEEGFLGEWAASDEGEPDEDKD